MEDIKHHLRELLSEVSVFPKGDLLINLIDNKCVPYFDSVEINSKLQKILNKNDFMKLRGRLESAVNLVQSLEIIN